jgi:hypothetical protein
MSLWTSAGFGSGPYISLEEAQSAADGASKFYGDTPIIYVPQGQSILDVPMDPSSNIHS